MKIIPMDPQVARKNIEKTSKKQRLAGGTGVQGSQATQAAPMLELYQRESCPFSHSVRNRMTQLGLDYLCHNVPPGNALKHEQLVQAGGKDQVPYLIDRRTGVKLYNSQSIIAYLENEYGQMPQGRIRRWSRAIQRRIETRADQIGWAIREPMERARAAVDDMAEGWNALKRSYQAVREAFMKQASTESKPERKAA